MNRFGQHLADPFYSAEERILRCQPQGKPKPTPFKFTGIVRPEDGLAQIAEKIDQAHHKFYSQLLLGLESKRAAIERTDGIAAEQTGEASDLGALLTLWEAGQATGADVSQIMVLLNHDPMVQLHKNHLALTVFLGLLKKLECSEPEQKRSNGLIPSNYHTYLVSLTYEYPNICQHLGKSLSLVSTLAENIEQGYREYLLPGVLPMQGLRLNPDHLAYELRKDKQSKVMCECQATTGTFEYPIVLNKPYLTQSKQAVLQAREQLIGEQPVAEPAHDLRDVLHQLVTVLEQQLGFVSVLEKMSIVYAYQNNSSERLASPFQKQHDLMLTRIDELKELINEVQQKEGEYSIAQANESLKQLNQKAQALRQLLILMDPRKGISMTQGQALLKDKVSRVIDVWLTLSKTDREQALPLISLPPLSSETSQRLLELAAKNPDNQIALITLVDAECNKGGSEQQISNRIHDRVHDEWWDLPRREQIKGIEEMTGRFEWLEAVRTFESDALVPHIAPSDLSQGVIPSNVINAFGINNRYQRWKVVSVFVDLASNGTLTDQEFKTGLAFIRFQINELYTPDFALSDSTKHLLEKITEFLGPEVAPQGELLEWQSEINAGRLFHFFKQRFPLFSIMGDPSQWIRFCKTFVSESADIKFTGDIYSIKLEESVQTIGVVG